MSFYLSHFHLWFHYKVILIHLHLPSFVILGSLQQTSKITSLDSVSKPLQCAVKIGQKQKNLKQNKW